MPLTMRWIKDAVAEHLSDAEKDGDAEWAKVLGVINATLDGPSSGVNGAIYELNFSDIVLNKKDPAAIAARANRKPVPLPSAVRDTDDDDRHKHPRDWSFGRPYVWQMLPKDKSRFIDACNYQSEASGQLTSMKAAVDMMLELGWKPIQILAFLKSKHMRWACDTFSRNTITSRQLAKYIDKSELFATWDKIQKELDLLVSQTGLTEDDIYRS